MQGYRLCCHCLVSLLHNRTTAHHRSQTSCSQWAACRRQGPAGCAGLSWTSGRSRAAKPPSSPPASRCSSCSGHETPTALTLVSACSAPEGVGSECLHAHARATCSSKAMLCSDLPVTAWHRSPALAGIVAAGRQRRMRGGAAERWPASPTRTRKLTCNAVVSTVFFPRTDEGRIVAEAYSLLPGDLRDTKACQAALEAANFDPTCPTYVLAECVLVYMEPKDSASVVRWLGHWLPTAAFVVYEQVCASRLRSEESV